AGPPRAKRERGPRRWWPSWDSRTGPTSSAPTPSPRRPRSSAARTRCCPRPIRTPVPAGCSGPAPAGLPPSPPTARARPRRPAPAARGFDGQYLFVGEGPPVRVVIDARDAHDVRSPELLHWCDLYFKANFWPHVSYDPKVHPIANGNGRLAARDIRRLRALR